MQIASQQTRGVSKSGAWEPHPTPRHRSPSCCSPPFSTTCSQLHTVHCEVHPGAVSRVVLWAVLVQKENSALVPALVFRSEPLDLERCPLLQPDSPWERSPKALVTLVILRAQEQAQSPPVTLIKWGLARRDTVGLGSLRADPSIQPRVTSAFQQLGPSLGKEKPRVAAGGQDTPLNRRGLQGLLG